jgi:hypothetical protein
MEARFSTSDWTLFILGGLNPDVDMFQSTFPILIQIYFFVRLIAISTLASWKNFHEKGGDAFFQTGPV